MNIKDIKDVYSNVLASCDDKSSISITLLIAMPEGEIEIITNPNVEGKIQYLEKAYTEDLVHKSCEDISIVGFAIGQNSDGVISDMKHSSSNFEEIDVEELDESYYVESYEDEYDELEPDEEDDDEKDEHEDEEDDEDEEKDDEEENSAYTGCNILQYDESKVAFTKNGPVLI